MAKKILIVNADDFGLSAGINAGIIRAHEHGVVTSASLMVRWSAATEAATLARRCPRLSVGLHVDLGEWTCENDHWRQTYQVVPNDDAAAVAAEIVRQLETFRRLTGRAPTHLDSHQHVHESEPVRSILLAEAKRLGLVLRSCDERVRYCGSFHGQSDKGYAYPEGISVAGLLAVLSQMPEGMTELGCHPAAVVDVDSRYRTERVIECATLCDARVRAAVTAEDIELHSFTGLQGTVMRTR